MKIDKIITLANSKIRLRFLAMERSLRAVGCDLPLWVIPYDDQKFDLPANAIWWELPEVVNWLKEHNAHPTMRKYQCLTEKNYQFVDADVVFLTNPEVALKNMHGFVTSCGHWNNPGHTYTIGSLPLLKRKSTLWQKYVFNTGQFACDQAAYSLNELKTRAESPSFSSTCLLFPYHEQPGINMLVNASPLPITNLTLPPHQMESTWAGDYPDSNYESYWNDQNKPYLIHWAGCLMNTGRPIDDLFLNYLKQDERQAWEKELQLRAQQERPLGKYIRKAFRKIKRIYHIIKE